MPESTTGTFWLLHRTYLWGNKTSLYYITFEHCLDLHSVQYMPIDTVLGTNHKHSLSSSISRRNHWSPNTSAMSLLAHFSVLTPADQNGQNTPFESGVTDSAAVEVEWNPHKQNCTTNGRHLTKSSRVSRLCNPRIRIERKQEAEAGYELVSIVRTVHLFGTLTFKGQLRHDGLSCNRSVRIDNVCERNIRGLSDCEAEKSKAQRGGNPV